MVSFAWITEAEEIRRIKDYFILDVETTGHDPAVDRILEFGMVRITDDAVANEASTLVNPGIPIGMEAGAITGIYDEDVVNSPRYEQLSGSLANLLLDSVVAVYDAGYALGFVRAMLEEQGYDGEIQVVDLARFAEEACPELAGMELGEMADKLGLDLDRERRVIARPLTCYYLMQECKSAAEQEAEAPKAKAKGGFFRKAASHLGAAKEESRGEEPMAPIEAEAETEEAPAPRRSHSAPSALGGSLLDRFRALSLNDKMLYIGAALCLVLALIFIPSLSSLFFLLAALVIAPIPAIRDALAKWKIEGRLLAILGVILCVVALLCRLPSPRQANHPAQVSETPSLIIISWDKPGDYGTAVTLNEGTNSPSSFIEFHLPAGSYRVLNNSATTAQVAVFQDGYEVNAQGLQEQIPVEDVPVAHVLAGNSKEITVKEDQYVTLSDGAENVIFQYLAPIAEPTPGLDELTSKPMESEKKAWVNGTEVRFRSTPSVNGFIMNTFDTGKEVVVTGTSGEWTAVAVDGQRGYIFSRYLSDTPPGAAASPSPSPEAEAEAPTEDGQAPVEEVDGAVIVQGTVTGG